MAGEAVVEGPKYWAFISYSHKDAAFGRRLHRRLETYAVPRRLVGRTTPQGVVPARLAPIFRDREELPAAHDLSAEVQAALKESRSLIVVCSPDAAGSRWVSREVELYRALHPDRPILAAVRSGEPGECFPAALIHSAADGTPIEPLAADFRRGRDGEHLGLLKLVAGIAGLGLDELAQRDAQRHRQRVTAITAASLVAVLGMGALTAFAVRARYEAEHQRTEAEGLVEFMLTDLRDRLKGVGRLDVMTAVNERALHYYSDEDINSLPVDSLERRARILHAMGEDDEERGDLNSALKKFQEAKRTTATLLAAAPTDPNRIFDDAQSEYWMAFVDWRRGHFESAEIGFQRYAALARKLVKINPNNSDWQMEVGYAESNLGTLRLRDKDDPKLATQHFGTALYHFKQALAKRPNDADIEREIADGYAWLADSQLAQGTYDKARDSRRSERFLLLLLQANDPKNAMYARDLLGNALGLARIDLWQGNIDAAYARLHDDLTQAERLSAADSEDKKLAKEKIAISLFFVDTELFRKPLNDAGIRAELSQCKMPIVGTDQELRDFCATLTARAGSIAGVSSDAAIQYLRFNQARLKRTRRSPRWGIDFHRAYPM